MNRLHVPARELTGSTVTIGGDSLGYLREVLRLSVGAQVEVFDGEGHVYPATLARYAPDGAVLELGSREDRPFKGVRVTLLQGLPKGDKFELIVQKAVELGVTTIVPVSTERSIVKLDDRRAADRVTRWQRIAEEAARQSQRADMPTIGQVTTLKEILARSGASGERRIVLDEEEHTTRLRDVLGSSEASFMCLVGPEGGLARHEVDAARKAGFTAVTLGPRILRTETVALTLLAIVQHVLGDLG